MADYKNIPVDAETHEKFLILCEAYQRKQGAQVKVWVDREYEKLEKGKLLPTARTKATRGEKSPLK